MPSNVIPFRSSVETADHQHLPDQRSIVAPMQDFQTATSGDMRITVDVRDIRGEEASNRIAGEADLDLLYPLKSESFPTLFVASRLLAKAMDLIETSIEAHQLGNEFAKDDCANQLAALLPELFCCRDIGEGYGALIIAIHYGLRNRGAELLTEDQLISIRYAIRKLSATPFISFEDSLPLIEDMERTALIVEPRELEYLADLLITND
jgi:hypothetical protein